MNIYLISANSYHLIEREIKKIILNEEYLTMNLREVAIEDLLKEANYFSLTTNKKIIVASNANFFGNGKITDKENELLINYFNNPNPETIIIFTSDNIDARKKIVKIIKDKYKLINIPPFNYMETEEEIKRYCRDNNKDIEYNALKYIMNNTKSLDCIYQELDKLFIYYGEEKLIKYNDVYNIVGSVIDDNNFHFVEAVINHNLKDALKIYQDLKIYKVESITLIMLLAREYRNMYYLKKYFEMNLNKKEIGEKLKMQDWQVTKLYNNSISYSEKELLNNLKKLSDIDVGIKTGRYDKDVALITFLIDCCS